METMGTVSPGVPVPDHSAAWAVSSPPGPRRGITAWRRLWGAALVVVLSLASGCATYTDRFAPVETALLQGDPLRAIEALEEDPGGEGDRVVYLLNRGALLRMAGEYQASNEALEAARRAIEGLDPLSVSESIGSLVVGETAFAYVGEPHERVLLHLVKAFNYLDLDEPYAARVEALQVDLRLRAMADRQRGSRYRGDPFARYLTGLIFERLGEPDQALVAYRQAHLAYREHAGELGLTTPRQLQYDLLRLAEYLGVDDDLTRWRDEFGVDRWPSQQEHAEAAHLVVIVAAGLAPRKGEQSLLAQDYKGRIHRVSLPYYEPRRKALHGARVTTGGGGARADAERVHDVDAVARILLEEQMGVLTARALGRLLVQKELIDQAADAHVVAGLMVNIFTVAVDRADTRAWSTLPGQYYAARLSVPPGRRAVKLEYLGAGGGVIDARELGEMELEAGGYHFVLDRWVAPGVGSVNRGGEG